MMYYRCQCGKSEAWGSMPPARCAHCPDCNTTLATSPEGHEPPRGHEWIVTQVDTDEGEKPLTVCRWCNRTKKELEK